MQRRRIILASFLYIFNFAKTFVRALLKGGAMEQAEYKKFFNLEVTHDILRSAREEARC